MKIPVLLYGFLRARFGPRFEIDVRNPREAIKFLSDVLPGFKEAVKGYTPGFRVRVGRESLGLDDLGMPNGGQAIRIVPCVAGAKSAFGQILTGIAIIAAVYFTGGMVGTGFSMMGTSALSNVAISMGMAMVLGGAAQLLAGNPAYTQSALDKGPNDTPSYAFSGPHMTTGQGNPVPLGYGKLRISGALISLGLSPETWTVNGFGGMAPDQIGTRGGDGDTSPWVWAIAPSV